MFTTLPSVSMVYSSVTEPSIPFSLAEAGYLGFLGPLISTGLELSASIEWCSIFLQVVHWVVGSVPWRKDFTTVLSQFGPGSFPDSAQTRISIFLGGGGAGAGGGGAGAGVLPGPSTAPFTGSGGDVPGPLPEPAPRPPGVPGTVPIGVMPLGPASMPLLLGGPRLTGPPGFPATNAPWFSLGYSFRWGETVFNEASPLPTQGCFAIRVAPGLD